MDDRPRLKAVGGGDGTGRTRARSTVAFPYVDLAEAERVAGLVARAYGSCRPEQLAAWLGHSTYDSGAFRNKVAAGKHFGLLEGAPGRVELTDLGRRLTGGGDPAQARVEAFLAVPLYRGIFRIFRGKRLPSATGLEVEMVRQGVAPSQVRGARQVFQRSAAQAGLGPGEGGHLVLPPGTTDRSGAAAPDAAAASPALPEGLPPVVRAILDQAPWDGTWTAEEFDAWSALLVQAARVHFRLPNSGG